MLETPDAVLALDRLQNSEQARFCPNGRAHKMEKKEEIEKLWVHKNGTYLFCQICGYKEQVSKDLINEASKL